MANFEGNKTETYKTQYFNINNECQQNFMFFGKTKRGVLDHDVSSTKKKIEIMK